MSAEYITRRATGDDIPYIVDCRRRMFAEMGASDYLDAANIDSRYRAWIAPRIADSRYVGWIAETASEAVASVGLELLEHQPHPASQNNLRGHVVNVYVEAAHRQQGLARHLMSTLLEWCAQQQIGLITLHASDAARPLYQALGFKATNEMIYTGRTQR